jgi:hypothetical protein
LKNVLEDILIEFLVRDFDRLNLNNVRQEIEQVYFLMEIVLVGED